MSTRGATWSRLLLVIPLLWVCEEAQAQAPSSTCATVTYGPPPPYTGPYHSVEELCRKAPRGKPAPRSLLPPTGPVAPARQQAYAQHVKRFIVKPDNYRRLGWLSDAHWRLTGPYQGCPPNGNNFGVHPAVRISYSPEVIDWLCQGQKGPLPDGAMIVKEMANITQLTVDRRTKVLSIPRDTQVDAWTVMIKGQGGSVDGWYWGFFSTSPGNPPIVDRSAALPGVLPSKPAQPDPENWLPTGPSTVVYPNAGFGNSCTNCHASAARESTYSSLKNIIGQEITYTYLGDGTPPSPAQGLHTVRTQQTEAQAEQRAMVPRTRSTTPFPLPLPEPAPDFLATFPQLPAVPFPNVWATRFPAETYDHVTAAPGAKGPGTFLTSDQCLSCHDATGMNASTPNMVFKVGDDTWTNLSMYAEWRASPMGLAGRDPLFYAQLESELNLAATQKGLKGKEDCIQSLCLHCHGVMGQRQLAQDTGGTGPTAGLCPDFLPPEVPRGVDTAGKRFTRELVDAWPEPGNMKKAGLAKYGALARDGISCSVCHHITPRDLDKPESFTGNFHVGPATEVYGPFTEPLPKPMENALNVTPRYSEHVKSSALCGTCHVSNLPVLDDTGTLVRFNYEQTTYLEWLNSDFAGPKGKSCQDCHMPTSYGGTPLHSKIANIQDSTFPKVEGILPAKDLALQERKPYARHTLYGLNVVLNAFFQQFPLLLGVRQVDAMTVGPTTPGLLTAREAALDFARNATADVHVDSARKEGSALSVRVTVTNKTGHHFPSGVEFRRAFLELLVLDAQGQLLWASGRTSSQGVILDGTTEQPLPSEFFLPGPDGQQAFQPHHEKITEGSQVQIYEALVKDASGRFTTSFLHRYEDVKDNRLRPVGWKADGPFHEQTHPIATGNDADYSGPELLGQDTVTYEVTLPPELLEQAHNVQATLYYQATPPYYLMQRFASAAAGPLKKDTERLYYMASQLDVSAPDASGQSYLTDWKLRVATSKGFVR